MNIFILDESHSLNAKYHCDKHVVKMIVEYAQMLSTALRSTGVDMGYKSTHINHPCNVWLRESVANWLWLRDLTCFLHAEWKYRYEHPIGRKHKSFEVIETLPVPTKLPCVARTPFVQCMPDTLKSNNTVESYREYYRKEKVSFASWKKRGKPGWF